MRCSTATPRAAKNSAARSPPALDSIAMMESLVAPEMAKKIDICRFETAEYLTKRGFPPFH